MGSRNYYERMSALWSEFHSFERRVLQAHEAARRERNAAFEDKLQTEERLFKALKQRRYDIEFSCLRSSSLLDIDADSPTELEAFQRWRKLRRERRRRAAEQRRLLERSRPSIADDELGAGLADDTLPSAVSPVRIGSMADGNIKRLWVSGSAASSTTIVAEDA